MYRLVFVCVFFLSSWVDAQTLAEPKNELKVLTWNIFMRPMFHDGQMLRAPAIVEKLKKEDYDIIIFQEAFIARARQIIWEGLKDNYPNQFGPGKGGLFKSNSGVWILSKLPFTKTDQIVFDKCKVADCLAKKGALFVEVKKNEQKFQIVGTHLQAEEGEKCQLTRNTQYKQIKTELLDKHYETDVPQLVAGDLNTALKDEISYKKMLEIMKMEDGETLGPEDAKVTWGGQSNDLLGVDKNRTGYLLDYILIQPNGKNIDSIRRNIKTFQKLWNGKQKDLSDHYAVEAIINF